MWGDEGDEGDVDEMDYEEEHADDEENIDPEELEDEDTKATKVSSRTSSPLENHYMLGAGPHKRRANRGQQNC